MSAHAERRARLLAQMTAGAVAVLPTAPEVARNSDSDYPYRHDSYFYYLTGFTEPEAVVVLVSASRWPAGRELLLAVNANLGLWVQRLDGLGDGFFAMAAGHAGHGEGLVHGDAPV